MSVLFVMERTVMMDKIGCSVVVITGFTSTVSLWMRMERNVFVHFV